MGLLLFLARQLTGPPADPGQVLFPIDPMGLDFHIGEPLPMEHQRRSASKWGTHGELANQYIRFMVGFEISWTLGNRAVLKCQTIDPFEDDPTNSYRPPVGDEVTVLSRSDQVPLFRGHVIDPRERALEAPNQYTVIDLDGVDVAEDLSHRYTSMTLGGDPVPIIIAISGNPTVLQTRDPHGLTSGSVARIGGVVNPGVHPVNGDRVVTVINDYQFSVPVNSTAIATGGGGTVEQLVTMRDVVTALVPILTQHNVTIDPDMQAGPLLRKQTFSDKTVIEILRSVSGQSGWVHRFVPNYENGWTLQMFAPGSIVAPFTIGKQNVISEIRIGESKTDRANTVIVRYGSPMTVTKHEYHTGDGSKRVFPLKYKYSTDGVTSPGYLIDWRPEDPGAARRIGVWGYDTLFEWVYRASDNALVQMETYAGVASTPLANGQIVETALAAQFPQTVTVSDVPVGHAPREVLITKEAVFDEGAARDEGAAELARLNIPQRVASFTTDAGLIWPGTAVEVDLPHRLMTGQWLVTAVKMRERGDGTIVYDYDLSEGDNAARLWQDKIRALFGGGTGSNTAGTVSGGTPGTPLPGTPPGAAGVTGTGTENYLSAWTSSTSIGNAPMFINGDGDLEAQAGIVANAAIVARDSIWTGSIRASVAENGNANVTLQPDGDVIVDPGGGSMNPLMNYDVNIGRIDKKYLTLHAAELWVETLVAHETLATIGGRIVVAPTSHLVQDLASNATTIHVKHNLFFNGDIIYMEAGGRVEFMRVSSGASGSAGNWSYSVVRNLDGTGANDWYAGDAIVNTGTVGNGFIDIYSVRSMRAEFGPTIVGNVRTSTEYNAWEPRWAIGNLRGIYGYPNSPDVYGAAFGSRAAAWVTIDPIGGVRIGHGPNVFAHITAAGSASFTGSITVTGGNAATLTYAEQVAMQQAATRAAIDLSNVANAMVVAKTGWAYPGTTLINGGNIFTGTIVANHIAARQITAAHIAVGTITATEIAAGTITADRLNVSTLSAISANLGTVAIGVGGYLATSGISWGSGTGVYIGWTGGAYGLRAGDPSGQRVVWDGGNLEVYAGNISINSGGLQIPSGTNSGGSRILINNVPIYSNTGSMLYIDGSLDILNAFFCGGRAEVDGLDVTDSVNLYHTSLQWHSPDETTADDYPVVHSPSNSHIYRKTNGLSGIKTFASGAWIDFHRGIAVDYGG